LENFLITLEIMGKGMAAIFVVLGLLALITVLLHKIFK
jgi:hypothetical protein